MLPLFFPKDGNRDMLISPGKRVNPIPIRKISSRSPPLRLPCSPNTMAKPNYQFEKRRREMDKKAKKEAKLRQKAEAARSPAPETSDETPPQSV